MNIRLGTNRARISNGNWESEYKNWDSIGMIELRKTTQRMFQGVFIKEL